MASPPRFNDHFSGRANDYAQGRPRYPAALVDFIASVAPRKERVWEAGCGSGQFTRDLAAYFTHVVPTDGSPQQLEHAPAMDRVSYTCALVEACPLANASVDLIVAAAAAHWFDLPRFYQEARRIGRPGARIVLFTYSFAHVCPEVDDVLADLHARLWSGAHWPPERALVDAEYATLPFPFAPLKTPQFQITAEWTLPEMLAYVDTLSGTLALVKELGLAAMNDFRRDMSRAWGDPSASRVVTWPLAMRAGRVHDASRAGAIVVKKDGGQTRILIARSLKNPDCWVFPKGHVDPGESSRDAAVREVLEETGVVIRILDSLGCVEYDVAGGPIPVDFFLGSAIGESDQADDREIRWCGVVEALGLLSFPETRELLVRAVPAIEAVGVL